MDVADTLDATAHIEVSEDIHPLIRDAFFGDESADSSNRVHAALLHHFQRPGGGARATLTYRVAALLGIGNQDGKYLSAAVECLHNASLVQDDMQDKSNMRRGQRSVAAKFGDNVALGLTDRLITTAFVCLSEVSQPETLPALIRRTNHAVAKTVDGQTSELCGELNSPSVSARLVAASQKSGPLFALSLELPLIFAHEDRYLEIAHHAAGQFGLGYQILDDLKDQDANASSEYGTNLVFAIAAESGHQNAEADAVLLARKLLNEAAEQAGQLPYEAGSPLIDLVDRLLPQLDAFSQ